MAEVYLARSARAALDRMPYPVADGVVDALSQLELEPTAGHRLRGRLAGLFSYRVGAYRIIYELRDPAVVRVVAIRHRSDAYGIDPR